MDFEAPDGSQVSCREVWTNQGEFGYTTISAYIDGVPYVTKSNEPPEEIDLAEVLNSLEPVTLACIQPLMPDDFTVAPQINSEQYYLKAPSYTYDDCGPGNTFVADCVLNEVTVLERLKRYRHRNIATYHGCMVKDGRISHICLQKYPHSLTTYLDKVLLTGGVQECKRQISVLLDGLEAAIKHLHSLGLAHNDVNADNVCVDESGQAVLIDFDSSLPFGKKLVKGVVSGVDGPRSVDGPDLSGQRNDDCGLDDLDEHLWRRYLVHDSAD